MPLADNSLNFNKEQIRIVTHLKTVFRFCNLDYRKCFMFRRYNFLKKYKPDHHYIYLYKRTKFLIFIAGHYMIRSSSTCVSLRLLCQGITRLLIPAVFILLCICGCTGEKTPPVFTIGFSQCVESDAWRKTMLENMKRELAFHPNVNFIYRQADGNSPKQVAQVKELLQKKIDLLIISPNEADPLTPVVEEAFSKGIPVIVVDRKISSPLYTAYVGGDNYEIGKMAGQYALHWLNGKGKIIEITGLPKSSPAIERHKGFADAVRNHSDLQLIR
jgi:ABC-type uncharacterized transport system substrate-binding protein